MTPLFAEYADYHRHPVNRLAHAVGFPLIGAGLTGLSETLGGVAAAVGLQVLLAIANVRVDRRLGGICTAVVAVLWGVGRALPAEGQVAALAVGVVAPVLTHVWLERRWPGNAGQFLRFERIGHLWFLDRGIRALLGR